VLDIYAILAEHKRVPDVLNIQASGIRIAESQEVEALEEPTIDLSNGYIRVALRDGGCSRSVTEVALFAARNGRRFAAVGTDEQCIDSDHASADFFAFEGTKPVSMAGAAGAFGTVTFIDFLDEDYLRDDEARVDAEKVGYVGRLVYAIPRHGTTIRVRLDLRGDAPTGVDEGEYRLARRIAEAHRKYDEIELTWSAAEATFKLGRKTALAR
jgi:hypothetical protein